MNEPLHRRFARAAVITAFNPFAQLARLGTRPSSKKHLRSDDDVVQPFKKRKPDTNKRPGTPLANPPKRARPDSFVTPEKASKPRVVPVNLSAKKKKPIKLVLPKKMNRVEEEAMDMDVEEAPAAATASSSSPGMGPGRQETPISRAIPSYGLQNTHTAILPYTGYASFVCQQQHNADMSRFSFRLNSIHDIIESNVADSPAAPNNQVAANTFFRQRVPPTGANWPTTPDTFPRTIGTGDTERPQWMTFFRKMYRYYHVLGCEYEILLHNVSVNAPAANPPQINDRPVVAVTYIDTFSAANNNQRHPFARMSDMEHWPDTSFIKIPNGHEDSINNMRTIRGQYKTGSAFRNVENDEDVRTWTLTTAVPNYTELMSLQIGRAWDSGHADTLHRVWIQIKLRYIVQFKDLNTAFRWPISSGGASTQDPIQPTAPGDILQIA